MHKKMKGRQRKAAAIILTAALVLSAGPVPSVLAETEASSETVQQEIPEEESTAPVTPETEAPEETEPQTDPVTEESTETESQTEAESETQTESVKESEEITETEITTEPEMVRENSEESEPETETSSESESESGNQTGQNEVGTEPETEPENEIAENVGKPMNIMSQNNIQAEEKEAASVLLTINGQASGEYSSLSAAVSAIPPYTEQATIKINSDLEVNESISQIYDYTCKNLIIDCGGYTVSAEYGGPFTIFGSNVTIQNGTFSKSIRISGGVLQLSNVNASDVTIAGGKTYVDSQSSISALLFTGGEIYYGVDSVTLSEDEISLSSGEEKQLTATMEPASANGKVSVSWKSSNEQIASVSSDGTVTAITAGEATITAEVTDGITGEKRTATCAVTVANPVATVKIGDAITSYSNLDEAAAAASAADGSTLTLLDDVKDRTQPLVLSGNMTFDLGNHTLSGNISDINAGILEIQSGTVTVVNGTVYLQQDSLSYGVNISNGATLAGNAIYQCDDKYDSLINLDNGTILGGTFKGNVIFGRGSGTISGGDFYDSRIQPWEKLNKLQGGNFHNCTILLSASQPFKDFLAIGYVGYDSNNTVVLDQNTEASFLYPLTLNCEIKAHDPHTYNYTGEDDGSGTHTYAEGTCTSCGLQSEGSYIVTIPKQAEIGGAVQTVSVTNNLSQDKSIRVSADHQVTLKREEDPDNTQIVSEVTFKDLLVRKGQSNEQGLSFGSPVYNNDESLTIPAGTYRGTLNFSISVQ